MRKGPKSGQRLSNHQSNPRNALTRHKIILGLPLKMTVSKTTISPHSAGQLETEADSAVLVETEVDGEDTTFVNPGHVDSHVGSNHGSNHGNGGDATDDLRLGGKVKYLLKCLPDLLIILLILSLTLILILIILLIIILKLELSCLPCN